MEFSNKVAIITGGATGIGKGTAKAFIEKGAKVIINGRRKDILEETVKELDYTLENIDYIAGDIGDVDTCRRLIEKAIIKFGRVDILINNAGVFSPKSFLEHTEDDFYNYIDTSLKGTFFASQFAIKQMLKTGCGSIVNIGSMWAIQAIETTPSSAYSAAKAGIHALTKNLAIEYAKNHIRVNAVAPAVIETPIYETFINPSEVKKVLSTFNSFHPLGRIGKIDDVVNSILFLASDKASFITGVILPIDGGITAGRHRETV